MERIAAEAFAGRVDADLGGYLYKMRIARQNEGKSGGYRAILCFCKADNERIFFLYGFPKNQKDNILVEEMKALKAIAESLVALTDLQLAELVARGAMRELCDGE